MHVFSKHTLFFIISVFLLTSCRSKKTFNGVEALKCTTFEDTKKTKKAKKNYGANQRDFLHYHLLKKYISEELVTGNYIAVGEIGLDLYWDKSTLAIQKKAFIRQIELAKKHNWQIYDSGIEEMIDLENPEKNGFVNHKAYIQHIVNRN